MARGVLASSPTNFFLLGSAILGTTPISIAAWTNTTYATTANTVAGIYYVGGAGTSIDGWRLFVNNDGSVRAETGIGSASSYAAIAGPMTAGAWSQVGAVFASAASRYAYLNGAVSTQNTTSRTPTAPGITALGVRYTQANAPGNPHLDGHLAEVGFWNVALTGNDMLMLAAGYSPLMVKPEALVAYYPLIRGDSSGDEPDLIGGATMVEQGTVAVQTHPRVYYPGLPWVTGKPTPAAGVIWSPFRRLMQGV